MGLGKKSKCLLKKVIKKEYFCSAFRWNSLHLQNTIMDTLVFKILSVVEAVVLVSTLCFFYLCYGGHF
ncbi:unnamed protein product [Lupinus luteus]|uniref:Uncharacterized protein n=1 Tax=Lupinus luteus TaxID=3873 RepID=A0AAV1X2H1_LUPLU